MTQNVRLTGPEITALWGQYMNDSMSVCVLTYFIKTVKDDEVKSILEFALNLSKTHVEKVKELLKKEEYPLPKGFTEEDINLNAPPLFSNNFMMQYLYVMTLHGMNSYSLAVGTSVRADQRDYFIKCNQEATTLYDKIIELMLHKGVFSRPPYINAPHETDVVDKQNYLGGWFTKKRPLNGIEVGNIYYNMQKTIVKIDLEIGFSQVCHSKEVREYFQRGANICKKHNDVFTQILTEDNLPSPRNWTSEVSNTIVSPFSDKLMLFHIVSLVSVTVGYYGTALSTCQRKDVILKYMRLLAEIGIYAEDGANILIKNGWFEQPPTVDDRAALARKK
ncbi:DUF3231 family protein [Metabacillus litoralis]|uniref:DUF3231 family protein n=1 Tax=Metabacillus TaxID=2675233 RepID=UPI001BA2477B|nr:DUF3231 family protein [Metabacillus litoralis]UHA60297.1 DUF3231 family protein [Metabacillus litoralis]